jgi:hypothetical protein
MMGLDEVRITRFVRTMRGGSQPFLAQASDGYFYVVKLPGNPQGEHLLFNECAGSELFKACGLAVAAWKPLWLGDHFIDDNRRCWHDMGEERIRPRSGLCFGSRYLGEKGQTLLEILPGSSFGRIVDRSDFWLAWLIDVCCEHADNRQAIFLKSSTGALTACFVDHGHLFGGACGVAAPRFQASSYLDPRIYPDISSNELEAILERVNGLDLIKFSQSMDALPDGWKTDAAMLNFSRCLSQLSNRNLVRNVMDTIVDFQSRRAASERSRTALQFEWGQPVLRPRILPGRECGFDGYGEDCRAFA